MKVIVTGATGNVGTSTVEALSESPEIDEIVGLARREPTWTPPKTSWVEANVLTADLAEIFEGADAVIHLAWAIQPSRDAVTLERINVEGSRRVFEAVAAAGRAEARPRLLGRRLLARPEGPRGRRGLAHRGHPDLVLLAPQGRGRARAGPLRSRQSRDAGRAAAPGADLQGRGRDRDPPPLRRPLPAQLPPAPRSSPGAAPDRPPALPGRALRGRRAGLPAGGPGRRRTAPSTSPPSRRSAPRSWPSGSACAASRCRPASCGASPI